MYPVLFRIGSVEITSFGALVATGAVVGLWLFRRELNRAGLPQNATDAGFAGIFGGLVGAKVWWTIEFFGTAPIPVVTAFARRTQLVRWLYVWTRGRTAGHSPQTLATPRSSIRCRSGTGDRSCDWANRLLSRWRRLWKGERSPVGGRVS